MKQGQQVICIDDNFPAWARAMYDNLPVKDVTYTIRDVMIGCNPIGVVKQDISLEPNKFIGIAEVTLLLVEITNKKNEVLKQEMGFKSDRFRPLEEIETKESKVVSKPITIKKPELVPA